MQLQPSRISPQPEAPRSRLFKVLGSTAVLVLLALIIWFGRGIVKNNRSQTILLYCYTGMSEVMEHGIFPAFRDYWKDQHGAEVEFIPTFAGSGSIVDRIISRVPADLVILSSGMDAHRLATQGLTTVAGWQKLPNQGVCCRSPLTLLVRNSHTDDITGFEDLGQPDLSVIMAHPRSSGMGEWSILAIYGSAVGSGYDRKEALALISNIWGNVPSPPPSAEAALRVFDQGGGDVLLTYESSVLASPHRQEVRGEIVPLAATVLCEPIVVLLEQNIAENRRALVHAFVEYLWSDEAQDMFIDYGFRALDETKNAVRDDFQRFENLYTTETLGGSATCLELIQDLFPAGAGSGTAQGLERE